MTTNINTNTNTKNVSAKLQPYNNPESYAMGKEAAKHLVAQFFRREITPPEFEKQFSTVEKYLSWYELNHGLPNSFTTDGDDLCELLKIISPSGAEQYKKDCIQKLKEAEKILEERAKAEQDAKSKTENDVDGEH
jgi:hypothetical protein